MTSLREKQRGVALLIALLVMAMCLLLTTQLWFSTQLSLARADNQAQAAQARHFSLGMLLWARDVLREDFLQAAVDTRADAWRKPIGGLEVPDQNALLSGSLLDLSDRFNLNNLVINDQPQSDMIAFFQRLLRNLDMDENLAYKAVDWIDSDQVPSPGGAEDSVYLARRQSHLTASGPFRHISELQLLDGMRDDWYRRLLPYVTALPVPRDEPTRININTAPVVLIKSLDAGINEQLALSIYDEGRTRYNALSEFTEDNRVRFVLTDEVFIQRAVAVQSVFLQAQVQVRIDGHEYVQYALLQRFGEGTRMLNFSTVPFAP